MKPILNNSFDNLIGPLSIIINYNRLLITFQTWNETSTINIGRPSHNNHLVYFSHNLKEWFILMALLIVGAYTQNIHTFQLRLADSFKDKASNNSWIEYNYYLIKGFELLFCIEISLFYNTRLVFLFVLI